MSNAIRPNRPALLSMFKSPGKALALGFGLGLVPWLPGTAGTAGAWLLFWLGSAWTNDLFWLGVALMGGVAGVWFCGQMAKELGEDDSPCIVWDEMVAFWWVLAMLPSSQNLAMQALAFVLFRFFDMTKPLGIGWVDQHIHGGVGIMLDDLLAAFATLVVMAVLYVLFVQLQAFFPELGNWWGLAFVR